MLLILFAIAVATCYINFSAVLFKTRQDDLFNSAEFYKTHRLTLHRQLNTVQLRNKRKKSNLQQNRERVEIIQIAKSNLVDDRYNKTTVTDRIRNIFFL